jgi:hypothetical protein
MRKTIFLNRRAVRLIGFILALQLNLTGIAHGNVETPPGKADPAPGKANVDIAPSQAPFKGQFTYQRRGGDVYFAVSGDVKSHLNMKAKLCWKLEKSNSEDNLPCQSDLEVRLHKKSEPSSQVDYVVTIPRDFKPAHPNTARTQLWIVQIAELTITDDKGEKLSVQEIGITESRYAFMAAIFAVVAAGIGFYRFATYIGVPGPKLDKTSFAVRALRAYSVPLRLISTSNGWASLSQFQIMLWTFVIGAGAVYVMSLTMSLIAISVGTLSLLGIAGITTVLTELKSSQGSQAPSTLVSPGKVTYLAIKEGPRETELAVNWYPPVASTAPIHYLVQYLDPASPGMWRTACHALRTTSLRIVGLSPNTAYQLRVVAVNSAGMGPEETITAPTAPARPTQSPSITGLQMQAGRTGTSMPLAWNKVDGATYVLEKRLHDSDAEWTAIALANPSSPNATVAHLIPNTAYDFRVRTVALPDAWSLVETFSTDIRTPKWSDLVTDTDRPAEIDVTRVQMLFFTIISAVFVAVNIIDTGTIPVIDNTYVTLMGISNGVYVTTKFVRV